MQIALFLLALSSVPSQAQGRQFVVRLLNAKNGKGLEGQNLTIYWAPSMEKTVVKLGRNGEGVVHVPAGQSEFVMITGPRVGSEPYRFAYTNCNSRNTSLITVESVFSSGIVPDNVCGKWRVPGSPGNVVFWALPRGFWDLDLQ